MVGEPEVRAFKMVCPLCDSGQFSISKLGAAGRPKHWPPEVLGVADCRGCQRDFLVKLPPEVAYPIFERIQCGLDLHYMKWARRVLGLE